MSPTKASLARSNPHILETSAVAKKNRELEPNRRQSLRDAVLGNRSVPLTDEQRARQESETLTADETISLKTPSTNPVKDTNVNAAEKENAEPYTPRHRDIERSAQQSRETTTPQRTARSAKFASPKIVPQLVESPRRSSRRSASAEMELPPTPVQLGTDRIPDRPRGLSSSSPGGRDKHRSRIRGGNLQTSPLKPRMMAAIESGDEADLPDDVEVASGLPDEEHNGVSLEEGDFYNSNVEAADVDVERDVAASDLRPTTDEVQIATDPDMIERNDRIKSLQAELLALQVESKKMQGLGARLNKNPKVDLDTLEDDFQLVLQNIDHNELTSMLATDQDPLFQKNASSYLTVFTDPSLKMSYDTWDRTVGERQKFVYQTTFTASSPWPPGTLTVTLDTWVDWDTDVVEDVISHNETKQAELSKWFRSRREDVVLKCDAATLLSGTSNFFRASIERARVWKALIEPQTDSTSSEPDLNKAMTKHSVTSREEATTLLPYLFQTQQGFASSTAGQKQTRRSLGSAKQLMLTYDIDLDWLGRPEIKTDILLTGYNQETVDAAKQLYIQVQKISGVVKALNDVKDILGLSGNPETNQKSLTSGTLKKKKSQARRMTFDNE